MSRKRPRFRAPKASVQAKIEDLAVDFGRHRYAKTEDGQLVRHCSPKTLEGIIRNRWILRNRIQTYDAAIFFHKIWRLADRLEREAAESKDDAKRSQQGKLSQRRKQRLSVVNEQRASSAYKHKLALKRRAELQGDQHT